MREKHWEGALEAILLAHKGGDILHIYNAVENNWKAISEILHFLQTPTIGEMELTQEEKDFITSVNKDFMNDG